MTVGQRRLSTYERTTIRPSRPTRLPPYANITRYSNAPRGNLLRFREDNSQEAVGEAGRTVGRDPTRSRGNDAGEHASRGIRKEEVIRGRLSKAWEVPVEGELGDQEGVARLYSKMLTALSTRCGLGGVSESERKELSSSRQQRRPALRSNFPRTP